VLLGLDPSTISRRLSSLERALGVRLFDRVPEGLVPLAAAEEILPQAEAAEAAIRDLAASVAGLDERMEGVVRVALPAMLASELIAPELPSLMSRYPAVSVELITGDAVADLSRREADLALRFVHPSSGDLMVKRVATLRFAVFGSRRYLEERRGSTPGELDWLDWDTSQAHLPDAAWLRELFPHVEPVLRANSLGVRLRALRAGLGVGVLAVVLASRYPELERVADLPEPPEVAVWLVGHRALRRLPRFKAVWGFLEERCGELGG
jgi:DNA-binding transcriptional LysR family regulator